MLLTDGKTTLDIPREGSSFFHDEMDEDEVTPIPLKLDEYLLLQPASLTDEQLQEYIIFYDFLGNPEKLSLGIYEYALVRKLRDPLNSNLDKYLQPVYGDTFFAKKGYDELSKLSWKLYPTYYNDAVAHNKAMAEGNLPLLKYLFEQSKPRLLDISVALRNNHIHIVKYIHENMRSLRGYTPSYWDKMDLETFKYLYELSREGSRHNIGSFQDNAIYNNSVEKLEFLRLQGNTFDDHAMIFAAEKGKLEVVKWLVSMGLPFTIQAVNMAISRKHLHLLEYFNEEVEFIPRNAECAASHGLLHILEHLHKNGCPLTKRVMKAAIEAGSVKCFEYLHFNGCTKHRKACTIAIASQSLECLKFAVENGYRVRETDFALIEKMKFNGWGNTKEKFLTVVRKDIPSEEPPTQLDKNP